ncbi:MAG: energy-coupling factor ABC transporter ATP-binding protein [Streptococcaceae bacterium]|jgi:energy-coupling factor transport system ATP-binding protein|nr:energy-coupling factor ABC transporter ATP-binding protein [Streptococcaceae bacterium]
MSEIIIKGLDFDYGEEAIFKNFNLQLDGRSTAIIGQNGAGKTTLMKLLNGLLKPTAGEILINGEANGDKEVTELARIVGYVFQNPNDQIFKSRVLDEVMYGALNLGKSIAEAEKSAREALSDFGLEAQADENPYDLSLSERKQISVASILAMDTEIIIFDEPTIGQDFQGKAQLKAVIQALREKGKTVISILHDMDFVAEVFERVIVLKDGQILADGSARDVFAQASVLASAGLELPHIAALSQALKQPELALTVSEFLKQTKKSNP